MSTAGHPIELIAGLGLVVTVVVAVRSTWSPCGLSMLSSITPVAEQGRGHRFRSTALWFVAGAVVGGAMLGGVMAALAVAVRWFALPGVAAVSVVMAVAVITSLSDSGVSSHRLPFHGRQVNERWLDQYRSWVYGAGFGWQIGCGLATYIVTAGVYLVIVLGALSGDPWVALGLGTLFGLVRGLAVFASRKVHDPASLRSLHLRLARLDPMSAAVTVATQLAATMVAAGWILLTLGGTAGGGSAGSWSAASVLVAAVMATGAVAVVLSAGWAVVARRRHSPVELAQPGINRG
jgi:MFS family permease